MEGPAHLICSLTRPLTKVTMPEHPHADQGARWPQAGLASAYDERRANQLVSNVEGWNTMDSKTASRHLTVDDLCAELGICRSTFYDWRAARKAPCCMKLPNGGLRIRRVDFERWLESRTQQR